MRVATFNLENLDQNEDAIKPSLETRIPVLRASLERLDADILCLQEVNGQETSQHTSHKPDRDFSALNRLVAGTKYESFFRVFTTTLEEVAYDKRNLVLLSKYPILKSEQHKNSLIDKLAYKQVTAIPAGEEAEVSWERPILYAQVHLEDSSMLHVINLHLKSKLASHIRGQKQSFYWKSAAGWAEGYFLSSIKRVGQALETRLLVERIFAEDAQAKIIVCGDFNSEPGDVPVEAIAGSVENTHNVNLRHTSLIACSQAIAESQSFSYLHHGRKYLLDHMLISRELLGIFKGAWIHNENLHDESLGFHNDMKFPESDHAAFVGEFGA